MPETEEDDKLIQLQPGEIVNGKYRIVGTVGAGAFGAVFRVKSLMSGEEFAMKTESTQERTHILKVEQYVLKEMTNMHSTHSCALIDRGRSDDGKYLFIVMTLVGESLATIRKRLKVLSLGTAVRAGRECMEGLKELHNVGFLHRDIKPGNFAIGRPETNQLRTVFILDFGLARRHRGKHGEVRTPRSATGFRGTLRYAPLGCHYAKDLGRKDDLESWTYLLVELTVGKVPWAKLQEREEVGKAKEKTRESGELYLGCPDTYKDIVEYIWTLKYWQTPDYDFIAHHLARILKQNKVKDRDPFDWELP